VGDFREKGIGLLLDEDPQLGRVDLFVTALQRLVVQMSFFPPLLFPISQGGLADLERLFGGRQSVASLTVFNRTKTIDGWITHP